MNRKTALLLLLVLLAASTAYLLLTGWPYLNSLCIILGLFTAVWGLSLALKDTSIVDIFWSLSFVGIAWYYYLMSPGPGGRRYVVLCALVSLWGLRLAWHIFRRHKGEDERYTKMRNHAGANWWWRSLFQVFLFQGLLAWSISSVLFKAMSDQSVFTVGLWELLGILLFSIGFYWESTADRELNTFKKDPQKKGTILNTGLWAASRHPNYFGETLIWWGIYCFTVPVADSWIFLFSPLMITLLLRYVSGAALMESVMKKYGTAHEAYKKEVPIFFPSLKKIFKK